MTFKENTYITVSKHLNRVYIVALRMCNLIFSIFVHRSSVLDIFFIYKYIYIIIDSAHWLLLHKNMHSPKAFTSACPELLHDRQLTKKYQFHAFKSPPKQFGLHLALFSPFVHDPIITDLQHIFGSWPFS